MPLVKRALRPEEAEWYSSQGYDPSQITVEDYVPDKKGESSVKGSLARGAGAAALPTIAGGAAAGATMAGLPALLAGLGFAPLTGGASLLIPAAGLIAGAGVGMATGAAQNAVIPDEWKEQLALDAQLHPYASKAGQIAALPLGGFNPGKDVLKAGTYGISKLLGNPVTKEGADAVMNTALGAGIGVAQEAGMQAFEGDFDLGRLGENALIGSVFTDRNRLGKLYKFPAPNARAVDQGIPEFARGKRQVVSTEKEKVAPKPKAPIGPQIPPGAALQQDLNLNGLMAQPELKFQGTTEDVIQPTAPRTPAITQLERSIREVGYTGELTPRVLRGWAEVLAEQGINLSPETPAGTRGVYTPATPESRATVGINEPAASVTTAPHELAHHIWLSMNPEVKANYIKKITPEVERINSERQAFNEANPDKKMRNIDPEEFFASEMGAKAAKRAASGENVGIRNWWKDTKSGLAARREDGNLEDIYRTEAVRLMNAQKRDKSRLPLIGYTDFAPQPKTPTTDEKKQPFGEDIIGEGNELQYSQVTDTKHQGAIGKAEKQRERYKAEREALDIQPRSKGDKPNTYPVDETYQPPGKAPERRHMLDEPTPGEVEVISKSLDDAFNYHVSRIKDHSQLIRLSPDVVSNIKGRTIEKLMETGIDTDGLRNTIFRRLNDSFNDEIADFNARPKTVPLDKPIGESGTTIGETIADKPAESELASLEETVPAEESASTEIEAKPVIKQTFSKADAPVKVNRAMSDVIARIEQVRKDLIAEGKPTKNAQKIAAIDEAIEKMKSLPEDEVFDVAKMMKKKKFQPEAEDLSLPEGVPANEGYRWVNLKNEDGTTERVLFNDKQYKGFPGDPYSFAKMKEGKMSHGMTKPGQKIEELGTRSQETQEDLRLPPGVYASDGYRWVELHSQDGSVERVLFNDKYQKNKAGENLPMIARPANTGSGLSHGYVMPSRGEFIKEIAKKQGETEDVDIPARRPTREGFFHSWAGTFDKLKKVDPKLTDAFNRFETQADIYEGWGNATAKDLQEYSRDDVNEVFAAHREAFRNRESIPTFEGDKAEISDILTDYFHDSIGQERRDVGMEVNGRTPGLNPAYVPDMLSREAVDLLVNKPYLPEGLAAAREWAEYIHNASDGEVTMEQAREYVKNYTRAMGSTSGNYLSVDYGPIRKAEGWGVPESLREKDAMNALLRYSRRAAKDLAMFKELEKPRDIAAMLELNDRQTGATITQEGVQGLSKLEEVKNAMKWVTGEFSSTQQNLRTPKFTAVVRLVNNLIMGPATGIRDTATVPVNMIPYIRNFDDLGAALRGIASVRENARASLEYGATKPNIDKVQFQDLAESPDRYTDFLRLAASAARKWQGREAIENFNRDVTFSIGKELAKVHILGARAGKESSLKFLKKFDTLVEGDVTALEGEALDNAVNVIAKNFTDRNQGTYSGRGLPVGIVDSQFAPFFSLQKWSLEKSNVIWKDVIKPAIKGEDYLPLLTYTLGSVMTGAAIQELNELLTNKKSQDPKVSEVLAKGSPDDYVAKLASLMQLGSFAGIISDITKGIIDAGVYGKTPRNIVSFPTATLALDMQERIAFFAEAIQQGEDPFETIYEFTVDTLSQNVQLARMMLNYTKESDDLERSGKFRDLRIYDQLEGNKSQRFPRTNPYVDTTAQKFKKSKDLKEAKELSVKLRQELKDESSNRFEYKQKLQGAKSMSYRTMPSPERNPKEFREYYQYLVKVHGKQEADAIVRDFRQQRRLNRIKAKMIR